MPVLVWESPTGRVVFPLDRRILVVGRDPVSDVRIEDRSVSRRHALVETTQGGVKVTDLASTGGTRINGAALTPELPSTLAPGDFISFGGVTIAFHATPPPASPTSVAATPPLEVPARRRSPLLLWGGAALGFLIVGALGALLVLQLKGKPKRQPAEVASDRAVVEAAKPVVQPAPVPTPEPPPARDPQPAPLAPPPPTPEPPGPSRAAPGELPPSATATPERLPDLVELSGGSCFPLRVLEWNATRVEGEGVDGRLYEFPRERVVRILDRADLARRAAAAHRALAPDDLRGRMDLAHWCVRRHARAEARLLLREALAIRPGEATARELLAAIGEG
ncbi:MAG: FHA domain-containing protein [Planctomycetaceae bacterium]